MHKTVLKKAIAIVVAVMMIWSFLPVLDLAGSTVYAQTTGTADGTYDFGNLGADDSVGLGSGYATLGDKFKVYNSIFVQNTGVTSGAMTQIYPFDAAASISSYDPYTIVLKAEGGSTCKKFTFKDLGLSAYYVDGYTYTFQSVKLVFKDAYGNQIGSTENYPNPSNAISQTSVSKLSTICGRSQWSVQGVAEIDFTFVLLANGGAGGASNLGLEDITIGDVSNTLNAAPTASSVHISGTAQVGQMLTGNYTYADTESNPEGATTFKWYRYNTAVGGGKTDTGITTENYSVTSADLGKYLGFEVTPVATAGTTTGTTVASSLTSVVVAAEAAPVAGNVAISGINKVAQTLTGSFDYSDVNGDLKGTCTYKWYRANDAGGSGEAVITGETGSTYVVQPGDLGKYIKFEVTPVAQTGTSPGTAAQSSYVGPMGVAEAAPVASSVSITGTAQVGQTLTGGYSYSDVNGDLEGSSTFAWYRYDNNAGSGKTAIAGATSKTYTVQAADLDKYLTFEVTPKAKTGTATGSAVESDYTSAVLPAQAAPEVRNLHITGKAQVLYILTAVYNYYDVNNDEADIATFKWYRYDTAGGAGKTLITGETSATYRLQDADLGKYISVEVTPTAKTGISPGTLVESSRTAVVLPMEAAPVASSVTISGTAQVGQTLTGSYSYSDVNSDLEGTSTFKWYRATSALGAGKTAITGANSKTYTVQDTDLGKYLLFEVTPEAQTGDTPGTAAASSYTAAVVPAEAAPVASSVSISGTAQVGQTLTGSYTYSDVNGDEEGTSTFKWYSAEDTSGTGKTAIAGATSKDYTVQDADLGKYLSFEVTPKALTGTTPGTAVMSTYTAAVVPAEAAPVASSVSISGTLQVGVTLTGSYTYSDVNGDEEGTSTFKWYSAEDTSGTGKTAIAGATSKDYTVQDADLGKYLSFEVTPKAKTGTSPGSVVMSSYTAAVVPAEAAPVASSVHISGTAQAGQMLTTGYTYHDVNGDEEGATTFKWYRANDTSGTGRQAITGATSAYYTVQSADLGKYLSFEVTPVAKTGTLSGTPVESSYTAAVVAAEAAPVASSVSITGTAQVGQTLTGSYTYSDVNGDVEDTPAFKWYRSNNTSGAGKAAIYGATASTYTVQDADAGKYLSFEVIPAAKTGLTPGAATESSYTAKVVPAEAAPEVSGVGISGTLQVGKTITGVYTYSDVNGDLEGTSTYVWYRADDAGGSGRTMISGATAKTYQLQPADLGKYMSFEVTPVARTGITNGGAVASSYSAEVLPAEAAPVASAVHISGTAQVGQTLTGSYTYSDVNGDAEAATTFKWYRSNDASGAGKTAISGATGAAYTLQTADLGKYISFEVTPVATTGTSPGAAVESSRTSIVVAAEAAPTAGSVQISGTAQVGQTLTGSYTYSDVNGDAEGATTFKWYRSSDASGAGKTAISGATSATYTLQVADYNKYISFEVTPAALTGTTPGAAVESSRTAAVSMIIQITYDPGVGTVSVATQAKRVGSVYGKASDGTTAEAMPVPTYDAGHAFGGWWTGAGGTGDLVTDATTIAATADQTLHAKWIPCYTVTYLAGAHGTLIGATSEVVNSGSSPTKVPIASASLPYAFTGWSSDGGTTLLTKAQVEATVVTGAITYTAYYAQSTFTVSYLAGAHGTLVGAASESVADGGHPAAVPTVTPQSNYTFAGWSCDGGTTLLTKAEVEATTIIGDVTYTACYTTVTYTIAAIADQTLEPVVAGYGSDSQQTKTITITRTGTGDLKNLAVALGGTNKDSFTITQPADGELNSTTTSTTFTIKVNDGLPKGSYTADVTITADGMTAASFGVTQVVSENKATKKQITFVVSDGAAVISGVSIAVNGVSKSTDTKGQAVYELANGTYGFSLSKVGFTAASGTVQIGADSSVICLVMAKAGEVVLPDGDGSTDAILIAGSGAVPSAAVLEVDGKTPGDSDNAAVNKHVTNYHIASLFNIRLLLNNVAIQPGKPITLGLPIPKALLGKSLVVVRINDDGTVTKFTSKVNGNMLFFTVSHLSKYAVLAANEENPETGDWSAAPSLPLVPLGAGVLLILAGVLVFFRKKQRT